MREILFRGKRIDTGEWIEGYVYRVAEKFRTTFLMVKDMHAYSYEVDPETVGQYTGLEDRNGKRIYEGDIVRWMSKNTYLVSNYVYAGIGAYGYGSVLIVTALESGFTLRPINDNAPDIPNANRKIDNYAFWNHHNQLEVIGNIHDNPELMEVQA